MVRPRRDRGPRRLIAAVPVSNHAPCALSVLDDPSPAVYLQREASRVRRGSRLDPAGLPRSRADAGVGENPGRTDARTTSSKLLRFALAPVARYRGPPHASEAPPSPAPRLDRLDDRCLLSATPQGLSPQQLLTAYGLNNRDLLRPGVDLPGRRAGADDRDHRRRPRPVHLLGPGEVRRHLRPADPGLARPAGAQANFFNVVDLAGNTTNDGWAEEEALDVETAHSMAPGASILVIEAASDSITDLINAINFAVHGRRQRGVDELGRERVPQRGGLRLVLHDGARPRRHDVHRRRGRQPGRRVAGLVARRDRRGRDDAEHDRVGRLPRRDRLVQQRRRAQPVRARAGLPVRRPVLRPAERARRRLRRRPEHRPVDLRDRPLDRPGHVVGLRRHEPRRPGLGRDDFDHRRGLHAGRGPPEPRRLAVHPADPLRPFVEHVPHRRPDLLPPRADVDADDHGPGHARRRGVHRQHGQLQPSSPSTARRRAGRRRPRPRRRSSPRRRRRPRRSRRP